jgi:hypothetical protein
MNKLLNDKENKETDIKFKTQIRLDGLKLKTQRSCQN